MRKWVSFILGALLILLGLNTLFGFFEGFKYIFVIIGGIGVTILLTPLVGEGHTDFWGFYYLIRRWVFGAFLVLSAFVSLIPFVKNILSVISYDTRFGGWTILIIGVIFLLGIFKRAEESDIPLW